MNETQVAYFDRFFVEMPVEAVTDCSHRGACDEDVAYWQSRINLSHISDETLAAELSEYGAWDAEELASRDENERRIIWIAAGNLRDEAVQS